MRITQQVSATCHGCRRRRSEVRFVAVAADTSAERSEAREDGVGPNATFRVASPLVMATRGSCVKWNDGCLALGACSRFMGARKSSHYLLLRRGVVPHDTTIDADIDCSGFAALRLREQPVQSTRVASAQCCGGRRCGGSLWRRSRRSERLRLTCLSPLGFTPRGAGQSERKRSESRALNVVAVAAAAAPSGVHHAKASKLRSRLRALITAFRRCGRRRHRGQARCRNAH